MDVKAGETDADAPTFPLSAKGLNARVPAHADALIRGEPENGVVDAHAIQPFYTGLVAKAAGMGITMTLDGDTVVIRAEGA